VDDTTAFRQMLRPSGVNVVRPPSRSPNLNAYAERFVLSIKSECLNRLVPLGENHLRSSVTEFVRHYHAERHHQGLDNRLIEPDETAARNDGPIACRKRIGEMGTPSGSRASPDAYRCYPEGVVRIGLIRPSSDR